MTTPPSLRDYTIERELLTSPRQIRRRGTRGYGTVFSRFLLVPLILMTLIMTAWGIHLVIVRAAGPLVPGTVVDKFTEIDSEQKTQHYLRCDPRALMWATGS